MIIRQGLGFSRGLPGAIGRSIIGAMEIRSVDITASGRIALTAVVVFAAATLAPGCYMFRSPDPAMGGIEEQITFDYKGHFLNSHQCFSPDDKWIVYDARIKPDAIGAVGVVEKVNVETGQMLVVHRTAKQTRHGPGAGAAAYNPTSNRVIFTGGPPNSGFLRPYGPRRRGGIIVDDSGPSKPIRADARDVTHPFTPGALRGGTGGHQWSGDGKWICFVYHDAVMGKLEKIERRRMDLRTVGVAAPIGPVKVDADSGGENADGDMFAAVAATVTAIPPRDSDEIQWAYSPSWVGTNGYVRPDGTRQKRAIAFKGVVRDDGWGRVAELYIVDLPERIDAPGPHGPLAGTVASRPAAPKGCRQRRLTRSTRRKYPGLQGPEHQPRSSPDGKWIAYLAKDDRGAAQIHLISPNGGADRKLTSGARPVESSFNWSPNGRYIAYVKDNSIFVTDTRPGDTFGKSVRLTKRTGDDRKPMPHAVVWSNRGDKIAFCRPIKYGGTAFPQIFIVKLRRK